MKKIIFTIAFAVLLCGCSISDNSEENITNISISDTSENTIVFSDEGDKTSDISTGGNIMDHTQTALPKDAEIALLEYLKCDSIETLSDSILPSSVADEMKKGKLQQANYYFAGFPCGAYTDVKISECSLMPLKLAKHYAEFLAESVSIQGVPADFTAEKGYDVVVSATYQFEHETETVKFRATNRVLVLKIVDDRWIIMTTADPETNKTERIQ